MARNALGRGLSALIREEGPVDAPTNAAAAGTAPTLAPGSEAVVQIDFDLIDPSPFQPRMQFDEFKMEELTESIKMSGIIQPILVRRTGARYQLIAGERRWRAAQRAQIQKVPAIVRDIPDEKAVEMTLIENLQREDLNAMEEAMAFERLFHEFGFTQEQIADRTGKNRASVSHSLRLLKLAPQVQRMVAAGEISASHARALITITDPVVQIEAAKKAAKGRVSVRQIERLSNKSERKAKSGSIDVNDPNVKHMLGLMEEKFGTKVSLRPFVGGTGGHLIFHYYENEALGRLYELLMVER